MEQIVYDSILLGVAIGAVIIIIYNLVKKDNK